PLFLAAAVAWSAGFLQFVAALPHADAAPPADYVDAIVVLTGGSGRLKAGLALLEAGRAQKLFVSGVYHGVDVAALLRLSQTAPRDLDCCIALGYAAGDTTGNARETAEWIAAEGFGSLLLVTANYHLPRSLLEFRAAMPEIAILAWPVHPPNVEIAVWWRWPGTAKLLAGEYTKYLAAKLRIWLYDRRSESHPDWLK
ncbi:MAG: YdcF family protein, partial [Alphaproteobacteria bacterium]